MRQKVHRRGMYSKLYRSIQNYTFRVLLIRPNFFKEVLVMIVKKLLLQMGNFFLPLCPLKTFGIPTISPCSSSSPLPVFFSEPSR